jgi:hypothetical protein
MIQGDAIRKSELYTELTRCKAFAKSIKASRVPDLSTLTVGKHMLHRQTADALLDCYLRTFETVYRVLHIPTFRNEYNRYWESPEDADLSFVVLMQLCLAIGTCFYDDTCTLRPEATRWVYEAQLWFMQPPEKSKMTTTGLQIMCLLQFARCTANVGPDVSWISAGSLLRMAMYMGLHRDPKYLIKMSLYRAEMRRRLWATILEILLQTSIEAGGPPLLSLFDYDTAPPSNFNDDQLIDVIDPGISGSKPHDLDVYTQTSVQIALIQSFPLRLAVVKFVNMFKPSHSFEEMLKMNTELNKAVRILNQRVQSYPRGPGTRAGVSSFQIRYVDFTTARFFLALHQPFLQAAQQNPAFYYSRKVTMDTALKIFKLIEICQKPVETTATSDVGRKDFIQLGISSAGPYRSIPVHSCLVLGRELLSQKEEDRNAQGLSLAIGGTEVRRALEGFLEWTHLRIKAGETNVKGHGFISCILAQLDGMHLGLYDQDLERYIFSRATESVRRCHATLKEVAGASPPEIYQDREIPDLDMGNLAMVGAMEDWTWGDIVSFSLSPETSAQAIDLAFVFLFLKWLPFLIVIEQGGSQQFNMNLNFNGVDMIFN